MAMTTGRNNEELRILRQCRDNGGYPYMLAWYEKQSVADDLMQRGMVEVSFRYWIGHKGYSLTAKGKRRLRDLERC